MKFPIVVCESILTRGIESSEDIIFANDASFLVTTFLDTKEIKTRVTCYGFKQYSLSNSVVFEADIINMYPEDRMITAFEKLEIR